MWVTILIVILVSLWVVGLMSWGGFTIWQGKFSGARHEPTPMGRSAQLIGFGMLLIALLTLGVFLFLSQPTALPGHFIPVIGGAMVGLSLIFLVMMLISPDPTRQCPHCRKSGVKEDVAEELVGIFKKGSMKGRQGWKVVPHAKYKLSHRCKACGYEWESTQTRRL
jgi:hypothetical protein